MEEFFMNYFALIIVGAFLVAGLIALGVVVPILSHIERKRIHKSPALSWKREKGSPKIAYKRANLMYLDADTPQYFQGVSGYVRYNPIEAVSSYEPGFHAYKTFQQAREHPQHGNVLLEVLLSGEIQEHEDGYTATTQRVLQVMVDRCDMCEKPAEYFIHDTMQEQHNNRILKPDGTHGQEAVEIVCNTHRKWYRPVHTLYRIAESRMKGKRADIRKISTLGETLPWLSEHNIVLITEDIDQFIPTEVPEDNSAI